MSELKTIFSTLKIQSLEQNGGTMIGTFPDHITMIVFLKTVVEHEVPVLYLRNISNSTRRFFAN